MLLNKLKGIVAVFSICLVFTAVASKLPYFNMFQNTSNKQIQYIIDAGHGIPDGGAVGVDGTTEQELNLSISLKVGEILKKNKVSFKQTRLDNNSIFTEGETIHAKKVSDVRQRITIANEATDVPFVSIHMNTYPNSNVHGIQIFYGDGDEKARTIAQSLQEAFNQQIQPDNAKVIKPISKNIYLFSHIQNPSILIECGFISNGEELKKLKDEEYQNKLAEIIASVLMSQG